MCGPLALRLRQIFRMNCGLVAPALRLGSRETGIVQPPPVVEISIAVEQTTPHQRRHGVDHTAQLSFGLTDSLLRLEGSVRKPARCCDETGDDQRSHQEADDDGEIEWIINPEIKNRRSEEV